MSFNGRRRPWRWQSLAQAPRDAVPALIQALKVRKRMCGVGSDLGKIGRAAKSAVPALLAGLNDESAEDRLHVGDDLCKLGMGLCAG